MDSLPICIFDETEMNIASEGLIDMNTNASGKAHRATKRPGNKSTCAGRLESEKKQGSLEKEIMADEGHEHDEEISKASLTTANSSSGVSSNLKPKDRLKRNSSQGGAAKSDMCRVKNINLGEIPLCPVGLSLSGSGMQLYVKMDKFLHKKQLAYLENQFVSKICKAKSADQTRKATTDRQSLTTCGDTRKYAQPEDADKDMANVDSQPKDLADPSTSSNNAEIPVIDLATSYSTHSTTGATQLGCDIPIKQEAVSDDSGKEEEVEEDLCSPHPSQRKSSIVNRTTISNKYRIDRDPSKQSHKLQVKPDTHKSNKNKQIKSDNKSRVSKRNQFIQTSPALELMVAKPTSVSGISQKRPMPLSVFTSNDLPLKRPSLLRSCSSADILIYQQRNNSSFFSPVQPGRPINTNNVSAIASKSTYPEANTALANKDIVSANRVNESESSKYALIDTVDHQHLLRAPHASTTSDPYEASPQLNYEQGYDGRMEESETSLPCADFDPSQALASGVVDAETLAKFAEYTTSMRRDLRQNYKRLSGLMRDFNDQVLEHARAQADLTNGNVIDGDLGDETFSSDSSSRCSLM